MQTNSYDCGAFVCAYAHCLAVSSIFNFTQLDISVIRQRMVSGTVCILNCLCIIYLLCTIMLRGAVQTLRTKKQTCMHICSIL